MIPNFRDDTSWWPIRPEASGTRSSNHRDRRGCREAVQTFFCRTAVHVPFTSIRLYISPHVQGCADRLGDADLGWRRGELSAECAATGEVAEVGENGLAGCPASERARPSLPRASTIALRTTYGSCLTAIWCSVCDSPPPARLAVPPPLRGTARVRRRCARSRGRRGRSARRARRWCGMGRVHGRTRSNPGSITTALALGGFMPVTDTAPRLRRISLTVRQDRTTK